MSPVSQSEKHVSSRIGPLLFSAVNGNVKNLKLWKCMSICLVHSVCSSSDRRVGELERENSRLIALTQNSNHSGPGELVSEIERLKSQLAAAQARERDLNAELTAKSSSSVKEEAMDSDSFLLRPFPHKSASLGLMVCVSHFPPHCLQVKSRFFSVPFLHCSPSPLRALFLPHSRYLQTSHLLLATSLIFPPT